MVTQEIPLSKLKSFEIKMVGDEICATQFIKINELGISVGSNSDNNGQGIKKNRVSFRFR